MLVFGLCLLPFALAFMCWLMFALARYALLFYVAVTVGLAVAHHGLGFVPCIAEGAAAGIATVVIGQLAFLFLPWPLRAVMAIVFVLPATIAGYHVAIGLAHITGFDPTTAIVLGYIAAVLVGTSALTRLASSPITDRPSEPVVHRTVWVVL